MRRYAGLLIALVALLIAGCAETAYRVLPDPKDGFQRQARIDIEGTPTVLALRSKWSESRKPLTDPAKYCDSRYYEAATR